MDITNLAQFKRFLQSGGAIELIEFATYSTKGDEQPQWNVHENHRGYGIVRKAEKVQTKSVKLEGGSWLDLDPASAWSFDGDTATRQTVTVRYHGDWTAAGVFDAKARKAGEYGDKLIYKLLGA